MKKIIILSIAIILSIYSGEGAAASLNEFDKDTVIIEFGNNSKIIFVINNKDDLETLQNYDLNKMLDDLKLQLEEVEGEPSYLKIEDESGTRYLKDTTIIVENKIQDHRVVETYDEVNEDDENIQDEDEPRRRRFYPGTRQSFNIDIGINNYLEDGSFPDENDRIYTVKPLGSWYIGLNTTYKTNVLGPLFIEWGGGIDWYNFKFENERVRVAKSDTGLVFFEDLRLDIDPVKSKLAASFIYLKAVPMLDFSYDSRRSRLWNYHGEGFRIGVGGYAAFRIASWSKFVYKNGDKERDKDKTNLFMENLRYGVRGQIGFRGIDLFFTYDINELFVEGKGPQLNAFTFGFTL